jgi:predicted CXXCH cytochrome family protein
MPNRPSYRALVAAPVFFLSLFALALAQRQPAATEGPSIAFKPASGNVSGELVGNERCRSCHRAELTEFGKTSHAHLQFENKAVLGCETCHGSGKAHVDAEEAAQGDDAKTAAANKLIFSFHGSPKENAERCLICHNSSKQQAMFGHSEHLAAGVSCDSCHATHLVNAIKDQSKGSLNTPQAEFFQVPKPADETRWLRESLLKTSQPTLCFSCHATVKAQFALPSHHRVPEGLMKCTDCHNPHGTPNKANLHQSTSETCVQCHVEKRGPFTYEHPASKVESCVTCHNPHGTTNRTLLVRRENRQLCLQCHTGTHSQAPAPHGRLGFQTSGECVRCHVTIHGSNFDVNFLR